MADDTHTLGFGVTYDMVAGRTACGQLLTLTSHRSDDEIPPHKHANDYLCIVLTGGFTEQEGHRSHERRAGCVFTHHAGETHHDLFGPRGAMCVNLHFPAGESGPSIERMCSPFAKVTAGKLAFELAAGSREELVMASLAAEIMGDLDPAGPPLRDRGKWIDRIVEAISDEPGRRWSLCELAGIAGRHRVHVAQSFRSKTGVSLGAFQRLRRLTCLSLALRRGNSSLAMLAAEFGYYDQSHMTSEFRTAFGISPGRYRREFH
ncbi:MAG: helix-turn-helix domain-containing protein [Sphingomicrobium sp.]